jgi:hypothetical protein
MTIKSYLLGPGTFELGAVPLVVSSQVRSLVIRAAEKVTTSDAIPVLSGEELEGDETTEYTFTAVGKFLQDIELAGVVDWSWANKGTEQPFRFVPSTALDRECSGILVPVPLDFGGEVDKTKRAESDFTWRIKGTPDLGDATP